MSEANTVETDALGLPVDNDATPKFSFPELRESVDRVNKIGNGELEFDVLDNHNACDHIASILAVHFDDREIKGSDYELEAVLGTNFHSIVSLLILLARLDQEQRGELVDALARFSTLSDVYTRIVTSLELESTLVQMRLNGDDVPLYANVQMALADILDADVAEEDEDEDTFVNVSLYSYGASALLAYVGESVDNAEANELASRIITIFNEDSENISELAEVAQ